MKIDQKAVAILATGVAFVAGSLVAGSRTETSVDDQAKVEKIARVEALKADRKQVEKVRIQVAYRVCRAENYDRANTRLDSRTQEKSDRTESRARFQEPILDCHATSHQPLERPVYMKKSEARKYIALILKNRAPIVRDGKVVGSETFRK